MNRIEKLKNDLYSFEELITLEKNATQLGDAETLSLIAHSRMSKTARGDKPVLKEGKAKKEAPRLKLSDRKNEPRAKKDRS